MAIAIDCCLLLFKDLSHFGILYLTHLTTTEVKLMLPEKVENFSNTIHTSFVFVVSNFEQLLL